MWDRVWEQLKSAILDPESASGFTSDFLANFASETYGLIAGIFISLIVANGLDAAKDRARKRRDRVRAATQWIRNHTEMLLRVREGGGQGDGDRRKAERKDAVNAAIQYAANTFAEFADVLETANIRDAFTHYVNSLTAFAEVVGRLQVDNENVKANASTCFEALKKLAQVVANLDVKTLGEKLRVAESATRLDFSLAIEPETMTFRRDQDR